MERYEVAEVIESAFRRLLRCQPGAYAVKEEAIRVSDAIEMRINTILEEEISLELARISGR